MIASCSTTAPRIAGWRNAGSRILLAKGIVTVRNARRTLARTLVSRRLRKR